MIIDNFLDKAENLALCSPDNFRVGAILVRGGNIISTGFNKGWKSHPIQASMYPDRGWKAAHAEIDALRGLRPYDVLGSSIFVVRLRKDGTRALARPCFKCFEVLTQYGIKKVYYSTEKGFEKE
jgi:deoxycytidylate deaminase